MSFSIINKRKIKDLGNRIPYIRTLLNERVKLYSTVASQREVIEECQQYRNALEKKIKKLENDLKLLSEKHTPLNSEDYINAKNPLFQIKESDIDKSIEATSCSLEAVTTANWFIPDFKHVAYGGLFTIFRFMEKLSQEGVTNRIIIYSNKAIDEPVVDVQIKDNFKNLKNYEIVTFDLKKQDVSELPSCDISFCTLWNSAYLLLKFNKTKRKHYFIQDYEPLFYPAGSTSALVESTYRFGFKAIVNTVGLFNTLKDRHNLDGLYFTPSIDEKIYYPLKNKNNKKIRIFFYARPNRARNGFGLGVETTKRLLKEYGDEIEIIAAGSDWDESEYGLKGEITNLGLLSSINEVAGLYRTCDIGFCFMLTRHPSYQPLEFMASGVATVTNTNETNKWLLIHNENCLTSEPSPAAMAAAIGELIDNQSLRTRITTNGLRTVKATNWDKEFNNVWQKISK